MASDSRRSVRFRHRCDKLTRATGWAVACSGDFARKTGGTTLIKSEISEESSGNDLANAAFSILLVFRARFSWPKTGRGKCYGYACVHTLATTVLEVENGAIHINVSHRKARGIMKKFVTCAVLAAAVAGI